MKILTVYWNKIEHEKEVKYEPAGGSGPVPAAPPADHDLYGGKPTAGTCRHKH